jgi:hypothetical protein
MELDVRGASAIYAGIAGALFTQRAELASLASFERSTDLLLVLILGGTGYLYGALFRGGAKRRTRALEVLVKDFPMRDSTWEFVASPRPVEQICQYGGHEKRLGLSRKSPAEHDRGGAVVHRRDVSAAERAVQ